MSVYDHRDRPAYGVSKPDPEDCENEFILRWWTTAHDELLLAEINEKEWTWASGISEKILAITPPSSIDAWRTMDPTCSRWVWYNVLLHFARSRAAKCGFTEAIRKPEWKVCPLCRKSFVEDSLPTPLIERLGIEQIDFCAPCLRDTVLQSSGNDNASKEQISRYLRKLAKALKRVPPQDFGEAKDDLRNMSTEERLSILRALKRKPTVRRVREVHGSWHKALVEAGVLEGGARKTTRGTHCLAKDGHMCFSLGEKTIDDMLHALRIPHEREPAYPGGNLRADFVVNGTLIEYFGLAGNPDYDDKTKKKLEICKTHGTKLISIFPADLTSSKRLESLLLEGLIE